MTDVALESLESGVFRQEGIDFGFSSLESGNGNVGHNNRGSFAGEEESCFQSYTSDDGLDGNQGRNNIREFFGSITMARTGID